MRGLFLAVILASAAIAAAGEPMGAAERAVQDRLLDESQRQAMIGDRMDAAIGSLSDIVADLRSNDLLAEGKANDLLQTAATLGSLGRENVPAAAALLAEACRQMAARKEKLARADTEVERILQQLRKLAAEVTKEVSTEAIAKELESLINKEQTLQAETKEWGKELFQDPDNARRDTAPLADRQRKQEARLEQLDQRLQEQAQKQKIMDPELAKRLDGAQKALNEAKTAEKLAEATHQIERENAVEAVRKQEEVIAALKEAAKRLGQQDDRVKELSDLREMRADVQDLLKAQEETRKDTEAANAEKFDQEKQPLQVEQRQIGENTQAAIEQNRQPVEQDAAKNLEQARMEMAKAEQNLQESKKDQAVESQKQAEKDLRQAMEQLDNQIAAMEQQLDPFASEKEKLSPMEEALQKLNDLAQRQEGLNEQTAQSKPEQLPPQAPRQEQLSEQAEQLAQQAPQAAQDMQRAAQQMQQAAQDMLQGKKQDAQQHQQEAMQALQQAQQQMQQDQLAQAQAMQRSPPANPKESDVKRLFGSERPEGDIAKSGGDKWDPMAHRERAAIYENYARELPLEYREVLEKYYEGLSK